MLLILTVVSSWLSQQVVLVGFLFVCLWWFIFVRVVFEFVMSIFFV